MGTKRRKHSPEFKAKVVLEVLKGLKTQSELASEYGIHPVQISNWKKEYMKNLPLLFGNKKAQKEQNHEDEKVKLFEKIGRLEIENDFLKKKLTMLG